MSEERLKYSTPSDRQSQVDTIASVASHGEDTYDDNCFGYRGRTGGAHERVARSTQLVERCAAETAAQQGGGGQPDLHCPSDDYCDRSAADRASQRAENLPW